MFISQRWVQKPPLGVRINPAHPLARGLVGCWLFNEMGGDKVYDLSGQGNSGTLTSIAFPPTTLSGWNPGNLGPAVATDGTDDNIIIGSDVSKLVSSFGSIMFWFAPDWSSGDGNNHGLFGMSTDGNNFLRAEHWGDNNWYIGWKTAGTDYRVTFAAATMPVSAGNLYCLILTWNDATNETRVYLNGVEKASKTNALVTHIQTAEFTLGRYHNKTAGADQYFDGLLEGTFLYDYTLTAQEVLELYQNPYGVFGWPLMWSEAAPPPTRVPRPPAVSGVPSAHF